VSNGFCAFRAPNVGVDLAEGLGNFINSTFTAFAAESNGSWTGAGASNSTAERLPFFSFQFFFADGYHGRGLSHVSRRILYSKNR